MPIKNYSEIDQRIHLLSQTIAKVNKSYLPEKEDDSHTNVYYDHIGQRIFGRWIASNNTNYIFTLNLENQNFEWLNDSYNAVQKFDISNKNIEEIETDIKNNLSKLGLNTDNFISENKKASNLLEAFYLLAVWTGCCHINLTFY